MTGTKIVKKKAKVVKRKKAIVSPDRVHNMDILNYWATGEKKMDYEPGFELISEGNILHYEGDEDAEIAYQDQNGKVLVNGDDYEWDDNREKVLEKLQKIEGSNTTSFECFDKAGIELNDIEVIDSQSDLNERIMPDNPKFKTVDKNVPKGATLTISRNFNKKTKKYNGKIWMKRIHRAGAILVKAQDKTYIASMDEDQYYIIECSKPSKTLVAAFNALKPAKVRTWEKKNSKEARRQGEWYFLPAPKSIKFSDNSFCDMALPMKSDDSNAHTCSEYEEIKKKHYAQGDVCHNQHDTTYLAEIHEAIENTAVNAWSVEGVD